MKYIKLSLLIICSILLFGCNPQFAEAGDTISFKQREYKVEEVITVLEGSSQYSIVYKLCTDKEKQHYIYVDKNACSVIYK
jgi:hypothetical protein